MPSLKEILSEKDREMLYGFKHKVMKKKRKKLKTKLMKTLDKTRSRVLWLK